MLNRRKGRPPTAKRVTYNYLPREFYVEGAVESVVLDVFELEALRLVDCEGLSLQGAAERMGTSRSTVWRLLRRGRRKLADAVVHGKRIVLKGR
ncbi:MAG TPA: DUF134 domain-containing protein [Euryarchaeota archaeon]|nr:DUF134 domain-containing protein [Euryarchaeota archaeon]